LDVGGEREAAVEFLVALEHGVGGGAGLCGRAGYWEDDRLAGRCRKGAGVGRDGLVARPVEAEVGLAFSGLADLFEGLITNEARGPNSPTVLVSYEIFTQITL